MTLNIPDAGLVESFEIYRKRKPSVTLYSSGSCRANAVPQL